MFFMQKNIRELLSILDQIIRVYEDILGLAKEKTDLVVAGKVAELENLVKLEQSLVIQVGRLEQQREETVGKMAEALEMDKKDFTLSNIMSLLDHEQQKQIKEYGQKLIQTLEQLKATNDLNSKLIKHALEYIDFSLNLITTSPIPDNTYEDKGSTRGMGGARNLFDVKL